MTRFLFILILLFAGLLSGQQKVNMTLLKDENGIKMYQNEPFNGIAERWSKDQVRSQEGYSEGKRNGLQRFWYLNEKLQSETHYNEGVREGKFSFWWENGKKSGESFFKNGKRQGKKRSWNQKGFLTMEVHFEAGTMDGQRKIWYEDGQLRSIEHLAKSTLSGNAEYYFPNGNLEMKGSFKTNEKNGFWENFRKDGSKVSAGKYWANDRHGKWTFWTCGGRMIKVKIVDDQVEKILSGGPFPEESENMGKIKVKDLPPGKARIQGKVFRQKDCIPVEGTVIKVFNSDEELIAETQSNKEGGYSLEFPANTKVILTASGDLFLKVKVNEMKIETGQQCDFNFYLIEPYCGNKQKLKR